MTILVCLSCFLSNVASRSWPEVFKAAATNYFALVALAVILGGLWLLFRTRDWRRIAGTFVVLAGAGLLILVLKDIRREIPLHRNSMRSLTNTNARV